MPAADRGQAFEAARHVLAENHILTRADPRTGLIETQPQEFQKTGSDRTIGAYLSSGDAQRYRRTITCRVSPEAVGAVVELRVDIERESTSQAETLRLGTEGPDRRQAGAEPRWDFEGQQRFTRWISAGRDEPMERDLLRRIRDRLSPQAAPPIAM